MFSPYYLKRAEEFWFQLKLIHKNIRIRFCQTWSERYWMSFFSYHFLGHWWQWKLSAYQTFIDTVRDILQLLKKICTVHVRLYVEKLVTLPGQYGDRTWHEKILGTKSREYIISKKELSYNTYSNHRYTIIPSRNIHNL